MDLTPGQHAIGIDIGGTKMAVGLLNTTGQILAQTVLATEPEQGFGRAVGRLGDAVQELLKDLEPRSLAGIGIGCAGPIDPARGLINNPYTLTGWDRCDIVSPLRTRFGVAVHLENDADAAAFGEWAGGAAQGVSPVVMLTFGTGVGGGAVIGGQVYRGAGGEHPELGHIIVQPDGPECYCGARGCLESIASGTAIAAAGKSAGFDGARSVFTAAANGDPGARAIIDRAVSAARNAAWSLCHTFLPQRLVLGGGIMDEHFDLFAAAIRQQLQRATQFSKGAVEVVQAKLGNDAGVVGAGSMALQRA